MIQEFLNKRSEEFKKEINCGGQTGLDTYQIEEITEFHRQSLEMLVDMIKKIILKQRINVPRSHEFQDIRERNYLIEDLLALLSTNTQEK